MWSFTGEERWGLLEGASIAGSRGGYQSGGARTAMAWAEIREGKKKRQSGGTEYRDGHPTRRRATHRDDHKRSQQRRRRRRRPRKTTTATAGKDGNHPKPGQNTFPTQHTYRARVSLPNDGRVARPLLHTSVFEMFLSEHFRRFYNTDNRIRYSVNRDHYYRTR